MEIRSTQCPSCGSPIASPRPGAFLQCELCGATLHIVRSSSGAPLAELAEISVNTALLARESARARLVERMRTIEQKKNDIVDAAELADAQRRSVNSLVGCMIPVLLPFLGIVFFVVFAVAGVIFESAEAGAVCALISVLVGLYLISRYSKPDSRTTSVDGPLRPLQKEYKVLENRVREIDRELDELTERL